MIECMNKKGKWKLPTYFKPFRWLQFCTEILTKSMFFPIEKYTIQLFKLTIISDLLMLFPGMTVVPPMSALSRQLFDVKMAFKIVSNITERLQYDDCSQFLSMTGLLTSSTMYLLSRVYCRFQTKHFLNIKKIALVVVLSFQGSSSNFIFFSF